MADKMTDLKILPDVSLRCYLPVVIGVFGTTCSGKSWLTDEITKHLSKAGIKAAIIRMDDFFRDRTDPIFMDGDIRRLNFDIPAAYLDDEIVHTAVTLENGTPTRPPLYDIPSNMRVGYGDEIQPSPVILVDGLFAELFLRGRVRNFKSICADATLMTCMERRIARDTSILGVTRDQVIDLFRRNIIPHLGKFMYPQKDRADLVIDTNKEVDQNG